LATLGASIILFSENEIKDKVAAFIICDISYSLNKLVDYLGGVFLLRLWPLFGWYLGLLLIWWIISAIIASSMKDDFAHVSWIPIVALVIIYNYSNMRCQNI